MLNKYNDVLTVKELCEILDIGKNTAYRLLQSGEVPSIRIGKQYRVPKVYVLAYLKQKLY